MPEPAEPRIPVGYVRRPHGLDGSVIVRPLTDAPEQRFHRDASLITDEVPPRTLVVARVRDHKDGLLLTFASVTDRDASDALRGVTLAIPASERRQLDDDEFWADDLEGLSAVDIAGRHLGVVSSVVLGAAQDRLVVTTTAGEKVEVPFVQAIVGEVDIEGGTVTMDPPEGLF